MGHQLIFYCFSSVSELFLLLWSCGSLSYASVSYPTCCNMSNSLYWLSNCYCHYLFSYLNSSLKASFTLISSCNSYVFFNSAYTMSRFACGVNDSLLTSFYLLSIFTTALGIHTVKRILCRLDSSTFILLPER